MSKLSGKIALVTGAADGIGAASAKALAAEGAFVYVTDINIEKAQEVAEEIGDSAIALTLNVCEEADWNNVYQQIEKQNGSLHILVNNAGGGGAGDTGNGSSAGGASGTESVASDIIQGTEQAPSNEAMAATSDTQESTESGSGKISASGNVAENGKIPEDIPPADNDDAIAAQIRVAAEAETDPEIRKKLWDEYRKYKGMNVEH